MKVLLDTNILIPAEPLSGPELNKNTKRVVALLRAVSGQGHDLLLHPSVRNDISGDRDENRKQARLILLRKYKLLRNPPCVAQQLRRRLGPPGRRSNDHVDDALIAAVYETAVDILVSEDDGVHKKAQRAGLHDRVVTLDDAIRMFRALSPKESDRPPPAVRHIMCSEVDPNDPIFKSFREDYPDFDLWLAKCSTQKRDAWVVFDDIGKYAGICIVKPETGGERSLAGIVLKICSFKVVDIGRGLSELLLKTVFDFIHQEGFDHTYVEVFPKHAGLIRFLDNFGFYPLRDRTEKGEIVLVKDFVCSPEEYKRINALEYNIKYGPNNLKIESARFFIVPVKSVYHKLLFPDVEHQLSLLPGRNAFGNAIRKAYLCRSPTKDLPAGSILLFYRSGDEKAVRCIGIVEKTLRSDEANEIIRFVGPRTVYTTDEIIAFSRKSTLGILFRYIHPLATPLSFGELRSHDIIEGPPRSIVQIGDRGVRWLSRLIK